MCRKKKRVIHPRYHSPCQTPYTALRSLLSVALSSGMVKSNLIIPFISDKVNVQPFRRHCSVISDEGVQFKTARVFNSTAIFNKEKDIMQLRVGSGLPNIQKKSLENFNVKLPNYKKQCFVERVFEVVTAKKEIENALLERFQSQKKFLLSKMFI